MSLYLGIDFGCRSCRTAVARDGVVETVRNRYSRPSLPVVLVKEWTDGSGGSSLFPFHLSSLKQELGKSGKMWAGPRSRGGTIREVLGQVREDITAAAGRPVIEVVVGIPGFFPDHPRAALRDAAFDAGFEGVRLYDEGLAAVAGSAEPVGQGTTLVYAVGAGVFSATVVLVEGERRRVLAASGERSLGGTSFDEALIRLILQRLGLGSDFADPTAAIRRLSALGERVKAGLSLVESQLVEIDLTELFGRGGVVRLEVRRREFEQVIAEPVERSLEIARRACEEVQVNPAHLTSVLRVGKSASIPLIERRLRAEFPVTQAQAGEEAVARGAAWFAGQVGEGNWTRRGSEAVVASSAAAVAAPSLGEARGAAAEETGSWVKMFAPALESAEGQWNAGEQREAIRTFERMMAEAHAYLGTLYQTLGQMYLHDGKFELAVEVLKKAVEGSLEGGDGERVKRLYHQVLNRRAGELAREGRLDEARQTVNQALEWDRTCEGCMKLKADIRHAMKDAGMKRRPPGRG